MINFENNYNRLLKQMYVNVDEKKLRNNVGRNTPLLPFYADKKSNAQFDNGFYSILGEFSRILLNKQLPMNTKFDIDKFMNKKEYFEIEGSSEEYLEKLIKEYIFNQKGDLKILNPYLFLYLPLSNNNHSTGEKEIALFLRDIFFRNNDNLTNFFNNKETNNLIIKLILNNLPKLEDSETPVKYKCFLENISEVFNEDIDYLTNHEQYLIENIEEIFAYYYFFYISQLILKINKGSNDNHIEDVYFLLDWESASKNRKSIFKGYNFLKDKLSTLFTHIGLIDQVNTLLGTKNLFEEDMFEYYSKLKNEDKNNFLKYLKKWIALYKYIKNFDSNEDSLNDYMLDLPNNFASLLNELYETLNNPEYGINPRSAGMYTKNFKNIAVNYFVKKRGSYGYVLNIDRDFLLVMTALCVKDKKIRLTQLFYEYERRGLFFDKQSKNEIMKLLTELNLIDKKSDSGDAQYVKSIL